MQVAFFGTSEFALPALHALIKAGHTVAPVVTAPVRPQGRGRRPVPGPVEAESRALGLELLQPEDPNDPEFVTGLAARSLEVAVLAAYGYILKTALLAVPARGILNIHPSLLPRYRGAAPIQRALIAGETTTGVSIIQMARSVDSGDVICQKPVQVGPDETGGELSARLAGLGAHLLLEVLDRLAAGPLDRTPQDPGQATTAAKLTRQDRSVIWHEPASSVHNRIRALSPEPGAVCGFRSQRLVLLGSRLVSGTGAPGELLLDRPGLVAAAAQGAVELLSVKPEGSRAQAGAAFRNGHRLQPGERLVSL